MKMKQLTFCFLLSNVILSAFASQTDSLSYGAFGSIKIYHPAKQPTSLVLFISGDGGWNSGVNAMAKSISAQGAMVAGINVVSYLKELKKQKSACYYPAADFEDLSLSIQKKYRFPKYLKPILMGYSSGATLAYGMLVQAPAATFKGGIGIGFCPDISLDKPLCKGNGLTSRVLEPGKSFYLDRYLTLSAPFVVFNGMTDQVCVFSAVKNYLKNMPNARLVAIPKVGHGFSVPQRWLPQLIVAFHSINNSSPGDVFKNAVPNSTKVVPTILPPGLPITIVPTQTQTNQPIALFLSGDGGWTSFDQKVAEQLAKKGISVIGLDTQQYFWNPQSPEKTTLDMSKILSHYLQTWNKKDAILIGYSFGACVAPFIANRMNNDLKQKLSGIFMLSPDEKADFEIHITDMLDLGNGNEHYDVLHEISNINSLHPVCFFGSEEDKSLIEKFEQKGAKVLIVPGSHHYDNNFPLLSEKILTNIAEK